MTQNRRYDPSIKRGKIRLEPIEWEKLAILNKPKDGREQPKRDGGTRRSKYARDNRIDRKRLLELFDRQYSNLKWNLFGTLSFYRQDIELWRAKRAFDDWIYEMIVDDEAIIFHRLRIIEHRAAGESCRFHFFLRNSHFTSKYILMARWKDFVSGEADLWYITRAGANKQFLEDAVLSTSHFEMDYEEF
jgi:hypothetical protein